jgi:murein tripeptide amidase MpaA
MMWTAAFVLAALAADARSTPVLPPERPWHGESVSLAVDAKDPWATPAERSGFTRTPRYDETVGWLKKLVADAPQLQLIPLGQSPEGRVLWMVAASQQRSFTPGALRATRKPTLLAQACIHAGEVDGKDAGLMLLRDLTVRKTKADVLDQVNFLFIPIFNVDGHERFSATSRINQRGPRESGWRTTARNLNLNRDYTKLDAPETRMLVKAINEWAPDLYLDLHVTDGADYEYDVTFGHNDQAWSPAVGLWLGETLSPTLDRDLAAMGHIPGPLIQVVDERDPSQGILGWRATPRYSNGYGDARHLPTLLVETHSLKPFRQRVLGTYVLLESALRTLGRQATSLREAVAADEARRPVQVPLDWKTSDGPPRTIELKGIDWRIVPSGVSGDTRIEYLGTPRTLSVPVLDNTQPKVVARRPKAYWIPPSWPDVTDRLAVHGITLERLTAPRDVAVEHLRIEAPKLAAEPFEGRIPVTASFTSERGTERYPAGSVRVSTDQPKGDLAILLLEPSSPDSFFQWGFFLEALQPTEYAEDYVLEPMAERMLAGDAALKADFERKLREDPAFAKSREQRLAWFYRRTPFYDERARLYPVAREE